MKTLHWITLVLVIIGAINWGLVGLFQFNLVTAIFGDGSALSRIVFIVVGISGIVVAATSAALTGPSHERHSSGVPTT